MNDHLRMVGSLVLAFTTVLSACAAEAEEETVVVFAAASLTDAFEEMADHYEALHHGVEVVLNLAGSQTLASQIVEGAPADVFASADGSQMERVAESERIDGPTRIFAVNRLAIAVEPGNPENITGIEELAGEDLVVVLAADEVPAGRYAMEMLEASGVRVSPDSLEVDVRAVLSKVALGEADAGIVYTTDIAAASGDVAPVPIPERVNVAAEYPIAVIADGPNPTGGIAFVDLVLSEEGRQILSRHGFGLP